MSKSISICGDALRPWVLTIFNIHSAGVLYFTLLAAAQAARFSAPIHGSPAAFRIRIQCGTPVDLIAARTQIIWEVAGQQFVFLIDKVAQGLEVLPARF